MRVLIFIFSLLHLSSFAQFTADGFQYQAVIRDAEGDIMSNASVTMRISFVWDVIIEDDIFYQETHNVVTNEQRLISLVVGQGTSTMGNFESLDWTLQYKLKVECNMGNGYINLGQENLMAVPYSMHSYNNWALGGNSNIDPEIHAIGTNNDSPLAFRAGGANQMWLGPAGKLSIGTSELFDNLRIHETEDNTTYLRLTHSFGNFLNSYYGASISLIGDNMRIVSHPEGSIEFYPNGTHRMSLDHMGQLAIGWYPPDCLSHVQFGADASTTTTSGGYIMTGMPGSQNILFDNNEILSRNNYETSTLFLNTEGGSVVINQNTTPGFNFAVNGTCAKPGGGSWSTLSDARLKNDIQPFQSGLSKIIQINPVTFSYNEKPGYDTNENYTGVIAQELQVVAPEMVTERMITYEDGSQENFLTVDPSAFTYMLINAVQEQQQKIEELETRVGELEDIKRELDEIKVLLSRNQTKQNLK